MLLYFSTDMMEFPYLNAVIFAACGILTFVAAFALLARLVPFNLWKEIIERQNTALAIIAGAVSLGMCVIIAAAVH